MADRKPGRRARCVQGQQRPRWWPPWECPPPPPQSKTQPPRRVAHSTESEMSAMERTARTFERTCNMGCPWLKHGHAACNGSWALEHVALERASCRVWLGSRTRIAAGSSTIATARGEGRRVLCEGRSVMSVQISIRSPSGRRRCQHRCHRRRRPGWHRHSTRPPTRRRRRPRYHRHQRRHRS